MLQTFFMLKEMHVKFHSFVCFKRGESIETEILDDNLQLNIFLIVELGTKMNDSKT